MGAFRYFFQASAEDTLQELLLTTALELTNRVEVRMSAFQDHQSISGSSSPSSFGVLRRFSG